MPRIYQYVGPLEFLSSSGSSPTRCRILNASDVLRWIEQTQQNATIENQVVATFIVDTTGKLWIADRHSEHVACANGQPVFSAGEMSFQIHNEEAEVVAVSNQSTGYCPEPESWPTVARALDEIGLAHPANFSTHFVFRLCSRCRSINIVKDDWFVCDLCDNDLSASWNLQA